MWQYNKASLCAQFYCTVTKIENQVTIPAECHGDETLFTSDKTLLINDLAKSAKLLRGKKFNAIKLNMRLA